ncbi:MAG TPA: bifunctional tetrahydrofolate synthase/dihydrofolate synthase [Gammaproteobacteria bacterium]|nr:bifunctional tetrahydrofolate synthase/dihydrofolate synthase [Gammaproteobacteria bacterium]
MRFHNLDDWLRWQESLHPSEIELGLERVRTVLERLSLARPDFIVVTVAGTNGKGSSVAILESILQAAGYHVGTFTSPHLLRYNERIRVAGEPVTDAELCTAFGRIDSARGDISLTYFEFGALAAIDCLQRRGVEVAVLEVGLGGRLDAVNVLDADVALITPVDVDHVAWLGSDREIIGVEKAGIMRAGRPVVISDPQPPQSVLQHADELGAPLALAGRDYRYEVQGVQWRWVAGEQSRNALPLPALRGDFQLANAAAVLMVLAWLGERFPVSQQAVRSGLLAVQLPGRFQVLPGRPMQILDVAHNPHSARALAQTLAHQPCPGRTLAVLGMLDDKDIVASVASLRTLVDDWYLASLDVPRGVTAARLREALGGEGQCFVSVHAARTAALSVMSEDDRLVIFGSFYTVAAALG